MRQRTVVKLGPVTAWEMVSSDAFMTTISFHLQLPWNIPRTHITRQNKLVRLLPHTPPTIRQCQIIYSRCKSISVPVSSPNLISIIVSISQDSTCISNVEELDVPQTSQSRSRSWRSLWDISRRVDGWMSGLPSSKSKSPWRLGKGGAFVVSSINYFPSANMLKCMQILVCSFYRCWRKLQTQGQRATPQRRGIDARMGGLRPRVRVPEPYCELCRWTRGQ